jgi:hypothetical protein
MSESAFVLAVCAFTVLGHISLLFMRGYLIGQCRKEQRKMRVEWQDWKGEQEQWRKDFEDEHKAPWQRNTTRKTA